MTAINLDLKLARQDPDSKVADQHLQRAIAENEQLLHTLHDFARRVRPSTLDDLGLLEAVESHVTEFQQRTGIEVVLDAALAGRPLPPVVAENVFRLLQESLTNVVRHANASQVKIGLHIDGEPASPILHLLVADDGIGQVGGDMDGERLGMLGMRERVDLLDGKLEIESSEKNGTAIIVRIPLHTSNPPVTGSPT